MRSQQIVEGIVITVMGATAAALSWLGAASDHYLRSLAESVLRTYRKPVTPEALARRIPWLRFALLFGVGLGILILGLGIATITSGL